jgi:RimJ/RimL family protein N-acetyltransferase
MVKKTKLAFDVRPYESSQRAALETMYGDFEPKRAAQGLPPEHDRQRTWWLDRVLKTGTHLVVYVDEKLVGHMMLIPMPEDGSVELANFLHQSVRNRGIGTALNRLALDTAEELGYERVWLCVEPSNRAAVRSYQKVGFRRLPGSLTAQEIEMEVKPRA